MSESTVKNDTKTIWERFLVRVMAWLAMDFWENDKRDAKTKQLIEDMLKDVKEYEAEGILEDRDMIQAMDRIKATAKAYANTNFSMPGGRRSANPVLTEAWDLVSNNPQLLISLFTIRGGDVKTMDESVKLGISRIRNIVKDKDFKSASEVVDFLTLDAETTEVEVNEG